MFKSYSLERYLILGLFETVGKNVQRRVFDCANSAVRDDCVATTYYKHSARHAVLHGTLPSFVKVSGWRTLAQAAKQAPEVASPKANGAACGRLSRYTTDAKSKVPSVIVPPAERGAGAAP